MNPFLTTTNDSTALLSAAAVTTSDAADLVPPSGPARPTRALIFGGAGNVKVTMADGSVVTIAVPSAVLGFIQNLAVVRVWATGTTATNITALW